jgi:hypothetical protein
VYGTNSVLSRNTQILGRLFRGLEASERRDIIYAGMCSVVDG